MARTRPRQAVDHDRLARIRRDDSLGRVNRITKSVGLGILAATGVLGVYLSKALPGHAATAPSTAATTGTTPAATTAPTGAPSSVQSPGSGQLSPPSSPPVASHQSAPVVSGAT